jgi:hypothetical protein
MLSFGSRVVSIMCVLLAAHFQVSIVLHTLISCLVQQDFHKTCTVRPRNMTFRRCGRESMRIAETGGRKDKARASEIEGSPFKARDGDLALEDQRSGFCTSKPCQTMLPYLLRCHRSDGDGERSWKIILKLIPRETRSQPLSGGSCTPKPSMVDPANTVAQGNG